MFDLTQEDYSTQLNYAKAISTRPEILANLSESRFKTIVCAVASNPSADAQTLENILNRNDPSFTLRIAENPGADNRILHRIMQEHMNDSIALALAENPASDNYILEELTNSRSFDVLISLASNPKTPPNALEKLSLIYDKDIQMEVALNPSTAVTTLDNMFYSDVLIASQIAKNPLISQDTLRRIYENNIDNEQVMASVAENKGTPADILNQLSKHPSESVRIRAENNPNIDGDYIYQARMPVEENIKENGTLNNGYINPKKYIETLKQQNRYNNNYDNKEKNSER
jgi:hypothetical protein